MAGPQFWREMESRFRALPDPTRSLRADWHYIIGSGKPGDWRLTGGVGKSVRVRFEALARQAGAAIDDPGSPDTLVSWLELLKGVGTNFDFGPYGIELHEDGTEGSHHLIGTLSHVCESSADYCCAAVIETQTPKLGELPESIGATPLAIKTDGDDRGPERARADIDSSSRSITPRRTPDLQSSIERINLVDALARELATIKQDVKSFRTASDLKQRHPDFGLWTHIDAAETKDLANGVAFTPKAYAENLTLRKFGITSRETLKKDRRKIRNANKAGKL
jgi:hypothetical protein